MPFFHWYLSPKREYQIKSCFSLHTSGKNKRKRGKTCCVQTCVTLTLSIPYISCHTLPCHATILSKLYNFWNIFFSLKRKHFPRIEVFVFNYKKIQKSAVKKDHLNIYVYYWRRWWPCLVGKYFKERKGIEKGER